MITFLSTRASNFAIKNFQSNAYQVKFSENCLGNGFEGTLTESQSHWMFKTSDSLEQACLQSLK